MGSPAALASKAVVRAILACSTVTTERSWIDTTQAQSNIGLLDSDNRAILDRHNVGPDELTMAVANASGWSSRLDALRR
jgi:hypothetical protein